MDILAIPESARTSVRTREKKLKPSFLIGGLLTLALRHLIPALFLIFYEGLLWFERSSSPKWLIFALSLIGVLNAWLANATVTYLIPPNSKYPYFSLFWPDLLAGKANANNLATLLLGVPPLVACILWLPLFIGCGAAFHYAFLSKKI